ncbi:Tat pathway signal sequence domain protein [Motilibacter deserti]|uniref:Tat pathway signal sequence domain protein n=1 Tax=Motilibacter deserti TaxID=2714956 RepID=A0ABX0GRZ6_9ACTN|nr:Tat pathway signal sequence domain protein [Motilibacter deserti]NHC12449.1 Tat pathway signal sequence domain protein [Motilibacter deserti]
METEKEAGPAGGGPPRGRRTPGAGLPARTLLARGSAVVGAVGVIFAIAIPLGANSSTLVPTPAGSADVDAAAPSAASGAAGASVEAVPGTPAPRGAGTGRDPVTIDEAATARQLALDPAFVAAGRDVSGEPGPEYLSFELEDPLPGEAGKDAPRRAAVYFYNYADDTLVKRVVNLTTGQVERTAAAPGMQPPASPTETATAFALFLAAPESAEFKEGFRKLAGAELTSPDQVVTNGMTYVAGPADVGAEECGEHRCLQFITQLPDDGPFIDITGYVVDLSTKTVAQLK